MQPPQRTLRAAKQLLRKEIKARLKGLSNEEKSQQSRIVTNKLLSLECYQNSRTLSVYLSMPNEVDTQDILADIFEKQKKCFIPHYAGDEMKMVTLKDQKDYDDLPVTSWNIKQPDDAEARACAIDEGGLDVVIVPGLGFTRTGLRLGRGKGYYDNYFRKHEQLLNKKPVLIGLAFECQMVDELPADEFDVNLDLVLHPEG